MKYYKLLNISETEFLEITKGLPIKDIINCFRKINNNIDESIIENIQNNLETIVIARNNLQIRGAKNKNSWMICKSINLQTKQIYNALIDLYRLIDNEIDIMDDTQYLKFKSIRDAMNGLYKLELKI